MRRTNGTDNLHQLTFQERASSDSRYRHMPKLKVFRTPAGFYDAYVAATSQKAALKAWGSDADLFARGIAEKVTDPKLMEAPLAKSGVVIKVSRGSAGDHFEAAEPKRPLHRDLTTNQGAKDEKAKAEASPEPRKPKRKTPRPSPAKLDAVEQAIDQTAANLKERLADIDARKRALDVERRDLKKESTDRMQKLDMARNRARKEYQSRLEKWAAR